MTRIPQESENRWKIYDIIFQVLNSIFACACQKHIEAGIKKKKRANICYAINSSSGDEKTEHFYDMERTISHSLSRSSLARLLMCRKRQSLDEVQDMEKEEKTNKIIIIISHLVTR